MVVDAAIVGSGDCAQFRVAVFDRQRLDLLGAVVGQAVLQVDAGKRRGKLVQIVRGRADKARELPEAPMGRRDGRLGVRKDEREPLWFVAMCFDSVRGALDRPRIAPFGSALH